MQASEASRRLNEFRMAGRRSTTRAARLNKIAIEATEVCREMWGKKGNQNGIYGICSMRYTKLTLLPQQRISQAIKMPHELQVQRSI